MFSLFKTRYRIIKKGELYFPQHSLLFWWRYYSPPFPNDFDFIHFPEAHQAVQFLVDHEGHVRIE